MGVKEKTKTGAGGEMGCSLSLLKRQDEARGRTLEEGGI